MRIRILGSAAGGGFPQWNCNCHNCARFRAGTFPGKARTQSSIAICGEDPFAWVLVNASPDILQQLQSNPDLQPARRQRDTGLAGIVLTDAQIDHVTGLCMLRESTRPWPLWCTDSTYQDLTTSNPLLPVLAHYCGIDRHSVTEESFAIEGVRDVEFNALPLRSKPPPYSPFRDSPRADDNIALRITDTQSGRNAIYAPGLGDMDDAIWEALRSSQCVLVDGTFWTDDEMMRLGFSLRSARSIGHLPQTGARGMIQWLDELPAGTRKILIHINNTNPILDERSAERAILTAHCIEVAYDGMEIRL